MVGERRSHLYHASKPSSAPSVERHIFLPMETQYSHVVGGGRVSSAAMSRMLIAGFYSSLDWSRLASCSFWFVSSSGSSSISASSASASSSPSNIDGSKGMEL